MIISVWSPFRADDRRHADDRRRCRNDRFSVHFRLHKLEEKTSEIEESKRDSRKCIRGIVHGERKTVKRHVLITFCLKLRENYLNARPTIFAHRSSRVLLPACKARRFNYARENSRLIFIYSKIYLRRSPLRIIRHRL